MSSQALSFDNSEGFSKLIYEDSTDVDIFYVPFCNNNLEKTKM